jgi:hypothetical protein
LEKTTWKNVEKKDKARFNNALFVATIKVACEQFHNNFRARFRAHPFGVKRIWLKSDIPTTNNSQGIKKEKNATCWTCFS